LQEPIAGTGVRHDGPCCAALKSIAPEGGSYIKTGATPQHSLQDPLQELL
jgi:hypothetical protein